MRHTDSRVEGLRHPMISGPATTSPARLGRCSSNISRPRYPRWPPPPPPPAARTMRSCSGSASRQPTRLWPSCRNLRPRYLPTTTARRRSHRSRAKRCSRLAVARSGPVLTDVWVQSIAVPGVGRYGFADRRLRGQLPPLRGQTASPSSTVSPGKCRRQPSEPIRLNSKSPSKN